MPSYTSNSDTLSRRIPDIEWKPTLLSVALIVVTFFSFSEFILRKAGFIPSVIDDPALWSISRDKVYNDNSIVILGASRILIGFDKATYLNSSTDSDVVYLAIPSLTNSLASLKDLADDEKFNGTTIVSIHRDSFLSTTTSEQKKYTDYYHNEWSTNKKINRTIATHIQDNLASVQSHLNIPRIISSLTGDYKNFTFLPPFATSNKDRSIRADYNMRHAALQKIHEQHYQDVMKSITKTKISIADIITTIELYNLYAHKIRERGGQVIFLRMPSGECGKLENYSQDIKLIFSTIASHLDHTFIDAYQWPALASFSSADCSHLDYRDASHFTLQLAPILSSTKSLVARNKEHE